MKDGKVGSYEMNSREWWEEYFRERWDACNGAGETRHFMELIVAELPAAERSYFRTRPLSIADWGCAFGEGVAVLQEAFPKSEVVGLDFAEKAIAEARRRHPELQFEMTEDGKLPREYDVVVTSNCLEHFEYPLSVMKTHLESCRKVYVLLVPYNEYPLTEYHRSQFKEESFPERVGSFVRLGTSIVYPDERYWNGRQMLVIYGSPSYMDERGNSEGELSAEREKWDQHYASLPLHDADEVTRAFNNELVERISELVEPGSRILEAGCGGGWQSLALAQTGQYKVTLMDFSEEALGYARRLFARAQVSAEFI